MVTLAKTATDPEMLVFEGNFTDNPEFQGYTPIFMGMPELVVPIDSDVDWLENKPQAGESGFIEIPVNLVVNRLNESFHKGLAKGGQQAYLPIDEGHKSMADGGDQLVLGKILDTKVYKGGKLNYEMDSLPEGTLTLMGKLGWYSHEIENIRNKKYGEYISIVVDPDGILLNAALCQVPAVRALPPVAVYSADSEKTTMFTMQSKIQIFNETKGKKMSEDKKTKRDFNGAKLKHEALTEDPTLTDRLFALKTKIGLSEESLDILGALTDGDALLLCDYFDGLVGDETPTEGEPTEAPDPAMESESNPDDELIKKIEKVLESKKSEFSQKIDSEKLVNEIIGKITTTPNMKFSVKTDSENKPKEYETHNNWLKGIPK